MVIISGCRCRDKSNRDDNHVLVRHNYLFEGEEMPEFGDSIPNITIPIGRDSRMPCIVNNLGSYRAAWLRIEEKDILTIHHHVITRNYRINLLDNHNDNRNFILVIKNVQCCTVQNFKVLQQCKV
ncbi:unnamed protein product [Oppiella nova]|uniref:Ig-like domain-containing protein n=1 Tax=Oppiella nova TaxID=334625 RepID=A0A7R9M3C9_9ACAR|nr:unnamed protein product [Oppiella nova]CAG2169996.1 unnamed protein product [Oppiella nova]